MRELKHGRKAQPKLSTVSAREDGSNSAGLAALTQGLGIMRADGIIETSVGVDRDEPGIAGSVERDGNTVYAGLPRNPARFVAERTG